MTARVLHVGEDHWHRLQVLRSAGLSVEVCRGIPELRSALRTGTDLQAVLLAASPLFDPAPAREIIQSSAKCPVILFSTGEVEPEPQRYDLVIHPLTDPGEWLNDIWAVLRKSRQICAESRAIAERSKQLRR